MIYLYDQDTVQTTNFYNLWRKIVR